MSISSFDAAIVGGSIAGAATAHALASLGLSVVVIEREARFRDRVRGEGLHPWGVDEADDLGLLPALANAGAKPLPVWTRYDARLPLEPYFWADDSTRGNVEHGLSYPLTQQALLDQAAQSGATVLRPASVEAVAPSGAGYVLTVRSVTGLDQLAAGLLVGADGARSSVRSMLGIETCRDPRHHWVCGLLIENFDLDESSGHAGAIPGGQYFLLPQGNGRGRLYAPLMPERAGLIWNDRSGHSLIALVAQQLPDGAFDKTRPAGPQGIFSNADVWPAYGAVERAVLVGDAAGANDPSIGQGIALSFRDARELREIVRAQGTGPAALDEFARRRAGYVATLRHFANWQGELWLPEGREADERRAAWLAARSDDPDIGGFGEIMSRGPRDLIADDAARQRYFRGVPG